MVKSAHNAASSGANAWQYMGKKLRSIIYNDVKSLFMQVQSPVNFFAMVIARHKTPANSVPTMGTQDNRIEIKRVGSWLMNMVLVLEVNGIVGYSSTAVEGLSMTSGWLEETAHQPYFVDMAGIAAVAKVSQEVGGANITSVTNDAILVWSELCGFPGRSVSEFVGARGGATSAVDMAKNMQTFLVPIPAFFSVSVAAAMPTTVHMLHGHTVVIDLAEASDLIRYPTTVKVMDVVGGSIDSLLYSSGYFSVMIRPATSGLVEESVAWASQSLTIAADNNSLLRGMYIITECAFASETESAQQLKSSWSNYLPVIRSLKHKASHTNTEHVEVKICNVMAKRHLEAVAIHARPAGNEFIRIDAGHKPEAPTSRQASVLKAHLVVDDMTVYDSNFRESQLQQYWHCPTMTELNIFLISFTAIMNNFNVRGSRNWKRATDITLTVTLHKDCFTSATIPSVTVIHITTFGRARIDYIKGQAHVSF